MTTKKSKDATTDNTAAVTDVTNLFMTAATTNAERFAIIDAHSNKIASAVKLNDDNRADITSSLTEIYNVQLGHIGISEKQAGEALNIALNDMPLIAGQASQVIALAKFNARQADAADTKNNDTVAVTLEGSIADKQLGITGATSISNTYASTTSSTVVPTSAVAAAYTLEQQGKLQAAVAAAASKA